jgi:acyl carrier protein phosphodiesterase
VNFLAHIYLSGENDNLKIGNFISDFIKGNKYEHFSKEIQNGIYLHQQIDTFTDAHKVVRKSKRRLHERYGHYDGVIIDVFYDYFLAKNWKDYSPIPLDKYEQNFLDLMQQNFDLLPKPVQHILPYMQTQRWLTAYATFEGIEKALIGINKRTKYKSQMHLAIEDLEIHNNEFEADFTTFFKDLCIFSEEIITKLF